MIRGLLEDHGHKEILTSNIFTILFLGDRYQFLLAYLIFKIANIIAKDD
jgi:hypothetical protein